MKKDFFLTFVLSMTAAAVANASPLEAAMGKTQGWGRFPIRELATNPKTGEPVYSSVSGRIIALYDQRAKDFCGTILYDKKKDVFALSTTERSLSTFIVDREELITFLKENPAIIACRVPSYLSTKKKGPLLWLGGAVVLGSLLFALGVAMAKKRIREIRKENGNKGVLGDLAMDSGWALAKVALMATVEVMISKAFGFNAPIVPVFGGAFYGKADFVLPILGGVVLGGVPAAVLIKKLFFDCYRSPLQAIAAAKAALAQARTQQEGKKV